MKKLLLSATLVMGLVLVSFSQETATTQSGKTVLLHENGTWKISNATPKEKQQNQTSCKSLLKAKINMTARTLSYSSVPKTEGEENQFTYQWFFDKTEGLWLELTLSDHCVRYGDNVKIEFETKNQFVQIENEEKSNCDGKMIFSFTGNTKTLQSISNETITSIEIQTKEGLVKEEMKGDTFSKSCGCISEVAANNK